jgi:predicted nucleic acid-binding Zn ribbon protein
MDDKASPLENILKDVIKNLSRKRPGEEEIGDAWAKAAGEAAARHSRPVSFRKSVLVVNVDGSSWLYELTTQKRGILATLERDLKGKKRVKDIRFRIGDIGAPKSAPGKES